MTPNLKSVVKQAARAGRGGRVRGRCPVCGRAVRERDRQFRFHGWHVHRGCADYRRRRGRKGGTHGA